MDALFRLPFLDLTGTSSIRPFFPDLDLPDEEDEDFLLLGLDFDFLIGLISSSSSPLSLSSSSSSRLLLPLLDLLEAFPGDVFRLALLLLAPPRMAA